MRGMSGKAWRAPDLAPGTDLLTHILRSRGVSEAEERGFLNPKVKDALPEPDSLIGMSAASARLADDVVLGRKVGIYTDYDADGATSAGVLGRWLRMSGREHHRLAVPHRIEHGYGPNEGLISGMFDEGCDTVYVLDSGTAAASVLNRLPEGRRASIFVIDHHMPAGPLPSVGAVVNPNRPDQAPGMGHLAAVGVTFLLCVSAQRRLIRAGHAPRESMQGLMDLLDYVALGTVCDVVPLRGANRAFVRLGIAKVSRDPSNPLGALLLAASKKPESPVRSSDFGFTVGPRINAEGRIGEPDAAARFLLETDPAIITEMAQRLSATNSKRQSMEKGTTEAAVADAETRPDDPVIIAVAEGHEGVVGISASRLKERFNAPAIVLTESKGGVLKGSARSVDGFNIGEAILRAADAGIIIKGGGHAMAGGVTLLPDRLEDFRAHMAAAYRASPAWGEEPSVVYDAALPAEAFSVELRRELDVIEPCGRDNPEPRFVVKGARVGRVFLMSDKHVKAEILSEATGRKALDAIMWNGVGTPLGDALAASSGERAVIAGRLEINAYAGREGLQMIVEDVLAPEAPEKTLGSPG